MKPELNTHSSQLMRLKYLIRLGKQSWWTMLLLWVAMIAPARAELMLRVAVEDGIDKVEVGSSTGALIKDESGQVLAEISPMGSYIAQSSQGAIALDRWRAGQLWIEPRDGGFVYIDNADDPAAGRWYRGRALIVPTANGLTAVNYVNLEHYLYSVVGGEMPKSWPLEALKAQAVAARSYALYQRQTRGNNVFDVGDTTSWQVYRGIEDETTGTQAAVEETRGQVLTHNGQIIEAVFHSSSGGHTENVEDVWTRPLPYLRAVQDFDQDAPVYQWTETISAERLRQAISGVGNILSLVPERTSAATGRIITMRVNGDAGSRVISGNELRRALNLRSSLFQAVPLTTQPIASTRGMASAPTAFQIQGRGFGHGLGMSQYGAYSLALRGLNYRQIVSHYYTGSVLAQIQVQ